MSNQTTMQRRTFIYSFALGSGGLVLHGMNLKGMEIKSDDILVRMIYNNTGTCENLENAWGLSAWIEHNKEVTLFDTGGDPAILKSNIEKLDLDMSHIKRIIISHKHWDHMGGLEMILKNTAAKTKVYVAEMDKNQYSNTYDRADVVGISNAKAITSDIWTTGSRSTKYKENNIHEQAIMLLHGKSMMLLCGCSHPGITLLAQKALETHPERNISLLSGGFHLRDSPVKDIQKISDSLMDLNIDKIAPSHCTGDEAIALFRSEWGDRFVDVNLGDTVRL